MMGVVGGVIINTSFKNVFLKADNVLWFHKWKLVPRGTEYQESDKVLMFLDEVGNIQGNLATD